MDGKTGRIGRNFEDASFAGHLYFNTSKYVNYVQHEKYGPEKQAD